MTSLRSLAKCIGLAGKISIVHDFYGYPTGIPGDTPEFDMKLSLVRQAQSLRGSHLDINVLRRTATFSSEDEAEIDTAINVLRELYAQVHLGIGRALRVDISEQQLQALKKADQQAGIAYSIFTLLFQFAVSNGALNVFFIHEFPDNKLGVAGQYPVVSVKSDPEGTGVTLAHEIGHILGLKDLMDPKYGDNVMFFMASGGPHSLTKEQGAKMRSHPLVKPGCL